MSMNNFAKISLLNLSLNNIMEYGPLKSASTILNAMKAKCSFWVKLEMLSLVFLSSALSLMAKMLFSFLRRTRFNLKQFVFNNNFHLHRKKIYIRKRNWRKLSFFMFWVVVVVVVFCYFAVFFNLNTFFEKITIFSGSRSEIHTQMRWNYSTTE